MTESPQKSGIYLLPNLFTTAGLFAAFYAIVMAMKGLYESAVIAIFVAMIADALDGRVARLTNTQSAFGAEYDSLADMVSFAVAPALIAYAWSLSYLGKLGWLVAFIYTASGALRLARFNTQPSEKAFFQGLPSPAAAALVSSFIWVGTQWDWSGHFVRYFMALITVGAGLLMVSNFRYYSFKTIDMRGKVPFFAVLLVVLAFVSISLDPPVILFIIFCSYIFLGPFLTHFLVKESQGSSADEDPH